MTLADAIEKQKIKRTEEEKKAEAEKIRKSTAEILIAERKYTHLFQSYLAVVFADPQAKPVISMHRRGGCVTGDLIFTYKGISYTVWHNEYNLYDRYEDRERWRIRSDGEATLLCSDEQGLEASLLKFLENK